MIEAFPLLASSIVLLLSCYTISPFNSELYVSMNKQAHKTIGVIL